MRTNVVLARGHADGVVGSVAGPSQLPPKFREQGQSVTAGELARPKYAAQI